MRQIKFSVECWLLQNESGKVVLLEVGGAANNLPSFFQPVTGGIEEDETAEDACIREVFEETGINIDPNSLIKVSSSFRVVVDGSLEIHKTVFASLIDDSAININPREHISYKVVLNTEVVESLYWQSNKDSWYLVQELIRTTPLLQASTASTA